MIRHVTIVRAYDINLNTLYEKTIVDTDGDEVVLPSIKGIMNDWVSEFLNSKENCKSRLNFNHGESWRVMKLSTRQEHLKK